MAEFASTAGASTDYEGLNDGIGSLQIGTPTGGIKPNVPGINGILILPDEQRTSSVVPERPESFMSCFADLFMEPSREEHTRTLCHKIASLAAGTLEGQRNCFVGLGARGIGKTQFFIALGDWFVRIGDHNCAFLYKQMGVTDKKSPFSSKTSNIRRIIHFLAKKREWANIPTKPWESSTDCLNWLINNNKRVFLVLDEFDQFYRVQNEGGLIGELSEIGGISRKRPLMVVLLGSSSHLRNLCFLKGDIVEMRNAEYPGVANAVTLNITKFLPLSFRPITTVAVAKHVLHCLGITASEDFDFALLCKTTRGEVRSFEETYRNMIDSTSPVVVRGVPQRPVAFDDPTNKKILSVLWHSVQHAIQSGFVSFKDLLTVMNLESEFTVDLQQRLSCPKDDFLKAGVNLGRLFQCADESVIAFDGDHSVSFLHPTDIEHCISLFGNEPRTTGTLTLAEEISLLNPNNAGTDEVNERLVCESLCERGILVEGLGCLMFASDSPSAPMACHGVVRRKDGLSMVSSCIGHDLLNEAYVGQFVVGTRESRIAAHLRKEYPDELDGDLIAIFRVDDDERLRYIIVRVQTKLGVTVADRGDQTPISKMMDNERFLLEALQVAKEEVAFVRVLWSSQRTKATTNVAQRIIVINSADMINYWIDPVKAFVQKQRLTSYGYAM